MAAALGFCAAAKQGKAFEMDRLLWEKGFAARQLDLTDVSLGGQQDQANPQMVKCWITSTAADRRRLRDRAPPSTWAGSRPT